MTRVEALEQIDNFVPRMPAYGADRNAVLPSNRNVSQISPAIRHRLVEEEELARIALKSHTFGSIDKFVQEVYWRLYWKSWLEMRPQVWASFRDDLQNLSPGAWRAAEKAMSGQAGIGVIDHFAKELVSTGYLHNHARMWFAAVWIHELGLPWQIGAEFFHQHLLDGDPASNTLSWRWVAGLHTSGKNYLARKSNIEKNVSKSILNQLQDGLSILEKPTAREIRETADLTRHNPKIESFNFATAEYPMGLWIHDDDLHPEGEFSISEFANVVAVQSNDVFEAFGYSENRRKHISEGLQDAAARNGGGFVEADNTAEFLLDWAQAHDLKTVVALQPFVGPLSNTALKVREKLESQGIQVQFHRKKSDQWWLPLGTAGFFGFWKKVSKQLVKTNVISDAEKV